MTFAQVINETKAEAAERAERIRRDTRRAMKEQIAAAQLIEERVEEARQQIAAIDAELDAETERHVAACAPLQRELEDIFLARVGELADGKAADPAVEARRRDLLQQLEERNRGLSLIVAAADRRKLDLQEKIAEARRGMENITVLRNRLADELTSQELRNEAYVLDRKLAFANARKEAAAKKVGEATDFLRQAKRNRDPETAQILESRLLKYRAELEASSAEQAAVVAESEAAYLARVNE